MHKSSKVMSLLITNADCTGLQYRFRTRKTCKHLWNSIILSKWTSNYKCILLRWVSHCQCQWWCNLAWELCNDLLNWSSSWSCALLGMFDRDQNGTIDLQEFQGLWNYLSQWRTLFEQFDRDRSGTIDAGELNTGLTSACYISRD